MIILQINTVLNSGSVGRIVEGISDKVLENGCESFTAYSRSGQPSKSNSHRIGSFIDLIAHVIFTRASDRHGFSSSKATRELVNYIDQINPDIIHLHNIHGYYLNIRILFEYLKKNDIPVVWTLHDCWSFTGHCTYFDSVNCYKWKTECYNCPKTGVYPKSWSIDSSRRNFIDKKRLFTGVKKLTIITPSKWLKNHVENSFLKRYNSRLIHNGIDLSIFKPRMDNGFLEAQSLEEFDVILGVASTWDNRKGLEDFKLLARVLSDNFRIVLIGLSKKQIKELPSNILGICRTEDITELSYWYSFSKIFINPTYQDNFPTTNIEALGCGTPVITYDTGGSIESIDIETGIVVKKGNIDGLIHAVKKIISSKDKYSVELCRKRAENHFDKEIRFQDYFNLYQELVES